MRPLRLILQAFGPYVQKQVIDFRELKTASFLLIHGPTGAGKTSVLDGIVFALYGVTSLSEQQARKIRSDHAPPHMATEVVFDFSIGKDCYRVRRMPEQEIPKKKGEGVTVRKSEAALWLHNNDDPAFADKDLPAGKLIAATWSEVSAGVEEIIGFKADQFRQVVILPQGRFRDFLLADSREREAILEILFKTGIFKDIQEALKEETREIEGKWKTRTEYKNRRLSDAGEDSLDKIKETYKQLTQLLDGIALELENARGTETEAEKNLREGEKLLEKIKEHEEARSRLAELESRKDDIADKKRLLQNARKTLPIREVEAELEKRISEKETASGRLSGLKDALAKAEGEEKEATLISGECEKSGSGIGEYSRKIMMLEGISEKIKSLHAFSAELESTEQQAQQCETERMRIKQHILDLDHQQEKKNLELKESLELKTGFDRLKNECEELDLLYRDSCALSDFRRENEQITGEIGQMKSTLDRTDEQVLRLRDELALMQKAWESGQAAVLAAGLREGEPCPVCGSTHHPAPAVASHELPSDRTIEAKKRELLALEKTRESEREALFKKQEKLAGLAANINILEKKRRTGEMNSDEIKKSLARKKAEFESARKAVDAAAGLEQDLEQLRKKIKSEQLMAESASEAERQLIAKKAGIRGQVGALEKEISGEYLETGALERALQSLKSEKAGLEQALSQAKKRLDAALQNKAGLQGKKEEAEQALSRAENKVMDQQRKFDMLLGDSGFASGQEYKNARIPESDINSLEREIQKYDGETAAAKEHASRTADAGNPDKPDIDALKESYADAVSIREEKIRKEQDAKNRINFTKTLIADIEKTEKELASLDAGFRVFGSISELANGKNRMGITFQRFVQAAILDDVLITSSRRLSIMSKGRFILRRSLERADKRTSGGLDLEVDDAYTGKTRPVSTLSGGESFLAALSLALGLSDVVQAYSGGIRLDTLFIDEGFGSLDSESLDLALKALEDLQKGGRLIAIISHVAELQERIATRLEVLPSRSGSRVRLIAP